MSDDSKLYVQPPADAVPSINPKLRRNGTVGKESVEELVQQLKEGKISALARAITMVESSVREDRTKAKAILQSIMPLTGGAMRIGVSGVPGVGKSTFLENYGMHLLSREKEAKVAVLAVDPSSSLSKGSILGDKTRMIELGKHPRAFIRPSAAGMTLGGVSRATKEAMLLCEAAGYTHIFVETVGVGQSETAVSAMVDIFVFLAMPGTGDELQGMKRGIMELADIIAMNKSEGEFRDAANRSATEIRAALNWGGSRAFEWTPPVALISALQRQGFESLDEHLDRYERHSRAQGWWEQKRRQQNVHWFESTLKDGMWELVHRNGNWAQFYDELHHKVAENEISPFEASAQFLERLNLNS